MYASPESSIVQSRLQDFYFIRSGVCACWMWSPESGLTISPGVGYYRIWRPGCSINAHKCTYRPSILGSVVQSCKMRGPETAWCTCTPEIGVTLLATIVYRSLHFRTRDFIYIHVWLAVVNPVPWHKHTLILYHKTLCVNVHSVGGTCMHNNKFWKWFGCINITFKKIYIQVMLKLFLLWSACRMLWLSYYVWTMCSVTTATEFSDTQD